MPYNYSNYSSLRYSATALKILLVGGFNPSEKYESQIGSSSQLLGKIKNVPNHQPVYDWL